MLNLALLHYRGFIPVWKADAGLFAIQQAAVAGFDLLEILLPVSMDFDASTVKQQLKQKGLNVVCGFNLPKEAHIPFYPREATRLIKAALDKAATLEALYLGGVLHGGIGTFSGHPRTREEEATLCDVWGDAAHYAAQYGINIGIEPVNRYEGYLCTAAAETLALIKRVNASVNCSVVCQMDTTNLLPPETSASQRFSMSFSSIVSVSTFNLSLATN